MTTLQTGGDCQTNDQNVDTNKSFPIESLRFPLDSSVRMLFTGYFNGYSVEVKAPDEMALLYHMGCFGKGSGSRSRPKTAHSDGSPIIIRKRQFLKRNYWYKKFCGPVHSSEGEKLLKEIEELSSKITQDSQLRKKKDVIDLVSSDEDVNEDLDDYGNRTDVLQLNEKGEIVVIVPNSDSEEDNYFAQLKSKCCLNRVKIQEKLMLTLQEAFFLFYSLGCLQIINLDQKLLHISDCWHLFTQADSNFAIKYVVYHYFRAKGYVVKPGIKFGGDYLLYKEGPEINHADFIVVIKCDQEPNDWISTFGHVRMAATTVKEVLIVEVSKPESNLNLPEELNKYSIREILLNRKLPVTINNDNE